MALLFRKVNTIIRCWAAPKFHNKRRFHMRSGYVEAVGSVMSDPIASPTQAPIGGFFPEGATLGICLSVFSSTLNATGLNVQKYAQAPGRGSPRLLTLLGVAMAASSGVIDMVALSFAPASLLAALGPLTLVLNLLVAPLINGSSVSPRDLAATALIFAGVATCVLNGPEVPGPPFEEGAAGLLAFLTRETALAWIGGEFAIAAALVAAVLVAERKTVSRRPSTPVGVGGGVGGGGGEMGAAEIPPAAALLYSAAAGVLCGLTVIGAKTVGEVAKVASDLPLAAVAATWTLTVGGALGQTAMLNRGLGRHSPLVVIPAFASCSLLFNLCGGAIFWGELEHFTPATLWLWFPLGVGFVIGGLMLLATRPLDAEKNAMNRTSSENKMA